MASGGHWPWAAADADRFLDRLEEFLTGAPQAPGRDRVLATVAFTDIVDSTAMAASMGDRRWREVLEVHDSVARREVAAARGRMVKSTGDGLLATFDGPARGIRCVSAIKRGVATLGLHVRAGLHTGEIELLGDDVGGIAVAIAARLTSLAGPGEVVVSSTVKDLVGKPRAGDTSLVVAAGGLGSKLCLRMKIDGRPPVILTTVEADMSPPPWTACRWTAAGVSKGVWRG